MACPYFMPTERTERGAWLHPGRLPLGAGWSGHCTAPGHENAIPSEQQLHDCCNLGYARSCAFRPEDSQYDCIRFAVMRESDEGIIVCYACEKDHLPAAHGTLAYDKVRGWSEIHCDARIQKMADCYLASYFARHVARPVVSDIPSET